MKKIIIGFCSVLLITAMVSCGSTWEISGNSVNVEVMQKDSILTVPAGTSVFCVDTPNGAMKCYAIPE